MGSDRIGMEGAGGVTQDHLEAERGATSKEARERNALLEEREVSETERESGCPSCGASAPCSTWLKITLGFTAAKAVARSPHLPVLVLCPQKKAVLPVYCCLATGSSWANPHSQPSESPDKSASEKM